MDLRVQQGLNFSARVGPVRREGADPVTPPASPMVGTDGFVMSGSPALAPAPLPEVPSKPYQPPATETAGWNLPGVLPELTSGQLEDIHHSIEASLAKSLAQIREKPVVRPAANHPGVELHNHLLGIVDTQYFIDKCAGGDARLLMTRLENMFRERPQLREEAPEVAKILAASSQQPRPAQATARHQLEKVLTASPCTPFDDVYTPRDELIKHHLEVTPEQMHQILEEASAFEVDPDARLNPESVRRLRQHLGAQLSDATPRQMVEAGITPRQAVYLTGRIIDRRYETFVEDSQRVLHQDHIHYSEQSISVNKLESRLGEPMMKRVAGRLRSEGIESDVRFLAMVGTTYLSEGFLQHTNPKTGIPTAFEQLEIDSAQFSALVGHFERQGATRAEALKAIVNSEPALLEKLGLNPEQSFLVSGCLPPKLKAGLERLARRGDVMGIDVASPEKEPFTARGMKNFDAMYDILKSAAAERGRPLVMRPHVGEGYPEMPEGSQGFHRYRAVQEDNAPKHYSLASANLETLITHLENRGYSAEQGARDGVIVRFGHATHLTQSQVTRIKDLGIFAEANLGSNKVTGALQPGRGGDFFEDHPLLSLLYHEVPTVLNTDAHGVMHTNLKQEYEQADRLIKMFQRNKMSLRIEDQDVFYRDLSPEQQERFNPQRLRDWAQDYEKAVRAADKSDLSR
ncbi:MAG: hypothetical protein J0I12_13955 [Candidatus Eremiobacteraeota bacterium]|nr:hypothetical protein [Candidatus Eremiobacteraeota bacterium]